MRKNKTKKLKLLKGELFMYFVLITLLLDIPTANVFTKAFLSETTIKNERLENKIENQKNINDSLQMQIDELVSMENIQKIANEYGLSYISNNIITIDK